MVAVADIEGDTAVPPEPEGYRLALLRFFRDLTEENRIRILVELDAIPTSSNERITQGMQRRLLDWVVRQGQIGEVERMIDECLREKRDGEV